MRYRPLKSARRIALAAVLAIVVLPLATAQTAATYSIRVLGERSRDVAAVVTITGVRAPTMEVAFDAGRGRLGSRSLFAPNRLRATDDADTELPLEEIRAGRWRVTPGRNTTVVLSVQLERDPGIDHVLIDPASTWPRWVDAPRLEPRIAVDAPEGWTVATGLTQVGPMRFSAPDVESLIDRPLLIGARLVQARFDADGVDFELVASTAPPMKIETLAERLRAIASRQLDLFHVHPFQRYVFLVQFDDRAAPFTRAHGNSSVYRLSSLRVDDAALHTTLPLLFSKSLIRAWNSKFVRAARPPRGSGRSPAEWFLEGVSDYRAYRTVVHTSTGDVAPPSLVDATLSRLARLERHPAYGRVSIAEMSRGGGGVRSASRAAFVAAAGFVLGFALDVEIRRLTDGARTLDDVLRSMAFLYGGARRGFDGNDALRRVVASVVETDALDEFFARHIDGNEPIAVGRIASWLGCRFVRTEQARPCGFRLLNALRLSGVNVSTGEIAPGKPALFADTPLRSGDRIASVCGLALRDLANDHRQVWVLTQRLAERSTTAPDAGVPIVATRPGRESPIDAVIRPAMPSERSYRCEPVENAHVPDWAAELIRER